MTLRLKTHTILNYHTFLQTRKKLHNSTPNKKTQHTHNDSTKKKDRCYKYGIITSIDRRHIDGIHLGDFCHYV